MSKELTALLLKRKIDGIKNPKEYLINCLKNQGFIKEEDIFYKKIDYDTCQLCKKSNFIFNSNEKICNECGLSQGSISSNLYKTYKQNIDFSKGSFIEPGTTIVKVIKNGVEVTRDLAKTNTFISQDPEDKKIKSNLDSIISVLEIISKDFNPIIFERVQDEILSLWFNLLSIKPDIRGREKLSLMSWSIYYPIVYNGLKINLQKISTIIGVPTGEVYAYNFIMKDIFKNTSFEKYISINVGANVSIELDENYINKTKQIKRDLKDYLSNPIKVKEEIAIIYYLSKIFNDKKYNLKTLADKIDVSKTIISSESSKIERFYNKNIEKRNRLFI